MLVSDRAAQILVYVVVTQGGSWRKVSRSMTSGDLTSYRPWELVPEEIIAQHIRSTRRVIVK